MKRPRRIAHVPLVAVATALSVLLGLIGAFVPTLGANAAPSPSADGLTEPRPGDEDYPAAAAGSMVRVKLAKGFLRGLRAARGRIIPMGAATLERNVLEIPIAISFPEGYQLAGGFAVRVKGRTTFRCRTVSVSLKGSSLHCGRDGVTNRTLTMSEPLETMKDGTWITESGIRLSIANASTADRMNDRLADDPVDRGDVVGTMTVFRQRLLRGSWDGEVDDRTGCWIGYYASDNSIWRGWAVQALVNRIPRDVGISQYAVVDGKPVLADAQSPAVAIGQRTPYMERIGVLDSKRIVRGTDKKTDNWWDTNNYGCNTNAPYVVAQGPLNDKDARAWRYDGLPRDRNANPAGPARPQWWAHPRVTYYDGPTGSYSWTCRGVPTGSSDTYWAAITSDPGFRSGSSDDAGRAPECRDLNLSDMTVTTRYSISKRGALEARSNQVEYPRYCSVTDNPLVGCWQEIYPLWDRAWAFQNHVYASALRANLVSVAQIKVPADYSETGVSYQKPISWRITDGDISGAWPKFTRGGKTIDFSDIGKPFSLQDWTTTSPYTVPGTGSQFTVSGYGRKMGEQQMSFLLTADTDGTWTWPTNAKTGRELPRPQVKLTFGYVISNYDNGESCSDRAWYDQDNLSDGRNNDSSGPHCLQGTVPTIWPLPASKGDYWKRVPDAYIKDKDGNQVRNVPTTTFDSTFLASCLQSKEVTVQDNSSKAAPNVGADYTWNIRIAGTVTSFSGC